MTTAHIPAEGGSYVSPSFEHARVSDVMRHGVITCPPETPLRVVARMMAAHHVHAIAVTTAVAERDADAEEPAWGVVTDHDLLRIAADAADATAGGVASRGFVRVGPDDRLEDVSTLMVDRGVTHAIVVAPGSRRPIGMVSTLDVAGAIAWGRA